MLSAVEEQKFFMDGYRDGLSGRDANAKVKGPGALSYMAGHKQGIVELAEAKQAEQTRANYEEIRVLTERRAFEQEIEHNKILKEAMMQTRQDLNDEAIKIIEAMGLAMDSKNETIQKLRDYKSTVVREVSEVTGSLGRLKELTSDRALKEQVASLKEFLALCEKIGQLKASGLFNEIAKLAGDLDAK